MNSQNLGLRVAAAIFGLFCLVHLWRLWAGVQLSIGGREIPVSASVLGAVIAGALSVWMWRLSSQKR